MLFELHVLRASLGAFPSVEERQFSLGCQKTHWMCDSGGSSHGLDPHVRRNVIVSEIKQLRAGAITQNIGFYVFGIFYIKKMFAVVLTLRTFLHMICRKRECHNTKRVSASN